MKKIQIIGLLCVVLLLGVSDFTRSQSVAQADTCPALVEQALNALAENCGELSRNTACYGHTQAEATFANDESLSQPGDRAELTNLISLQTSTFNLENQEWGVAALNVSIANIDNTIPDNGVHMILLGEAEVQNAVTPDNALIVAEPVEVAVSSSGAVNLRGGPGTNNPVVNVAANGALLQAVGQNEAGDWVMIVQDDGSNAWIARTLLVTSDTQGLDNLPVAGGDAFTPMQSFFFKTGLGFSGCVESPDALVIQTPQENAVDLVINGAPVSIGSTVALIGEESDYGTLLSFGVIPEALEALNLTDDVVCRHARMVVLDGAVEANDVAQRIPIGHFAEMVSCFPDGIDNAPMMTEWQNIVRLSQTELAVFQTVANLPEDALLYPIDIPSDEQIENADATPTSRPQPTRVQATRVPATAVPTSDTGGGGQQPTTAPQPTAVPQPTEDTSGGVDCSGLRATSPQPGPLTQRAITFYWDGIAGVTAYQLAVDVYLNEQYLTTKLYRVGANQTNVYVDMNADAAYNDANRIVWKVQALTGDPSSYFTACETGFLENFIPSL